MKKLSDKALRHAETYILRNARILERRRFEYFVGSGRAEDVVTALLPYRTADGGFGNALEPDGRGPGSQPAAVLMALLVLDEVGAVGGPVVAGVCDHLVSISAPDGGLPFVHPNIRDYPRAPWWQIPDSYSGSLLPTAHIVGLLHKHKVEHPWLEPATEFCWRAIDKLTGMHFYEASSVVAFLDHVPDRERAEKAAAPIGRLVRDAGMVTIVDPSQSTADLGEVHFAYEFAPTPESVARQWFSDDEVESGLDFLIESQQDDGSWPVRWEIWNPVTAYEWGGVMTVEMLKTLRRFGRLS